VGATRERDVNDGEESEPGEGQPARQEPVDEPLPWEVENEGTEEPPSRHDAFTGARKNMYLKALTKTGCILDACRLTGVPARTVYNHQGTDPDFARNCRLAIELASAPIELTAYERAVIGVEEDVIRGGKVVATRMKRSDYMLRVLLQGSNPKKYGPRPGFTRKRLVKEERKQIEREVRAEIASGMRATEEETVKVLAFRLKAFDARNREKKLAEGWTLTEEGHLIPPGWVKGDGSGSGSPPADGSSGGI
jgi:hypothetical protein